MFPSWWSSEDTKAMLKMAMSDEWADMNYAVEKSDVTKHYGYLSLEHMNLRGLAETIEGRNIFEGATFDPFCSIDIMFHFDVVWQLWVFMPHSHAAS
ncbi:hypothetical protein DFS34DRAFT_620680 [Phlyctochytrium arcticum]|nr:hypothetical protein DFS34DRAFT_620680 [Phlyctochytrium arcticum]